jgi:hypothetical protein
MVPQAMALDRFEVMAAPPLKRSWRGRKAWLLMRSAICLSRIAIIKGFVKYLFRRASSTLWWERLRVIQGRMVQQRMQNSIIPKAFCLTPPGISTLQIRITV